MIQGRNLHSRKMKNKMTPVGYTEKLTGRKVEFKVTYINGNDTTNEEIGENTKNTKLIK